MNRPYQGCESGACVSARRYRYTFPHVGIIISAGIELCKQFAALPA
jgi:hypothetical protein